MARQIIFHVGFPKTGTTTLQAKIFPAISSLNYIGKDPRKTPNFSDDYKQFFEQLIHYTDKKFYEELDTLKTSATDLFKLNTDGIKLFSHEGLIRSTYMSRDKKKYQDIYRTLSRMQQIFDGLEGNQLRIMVTIRRQDILLPSYYAEFYRDEQAIEHHYGFNKFLKLRLNQDSPCSFPESLNYFKLYQHLVNLLAKENILVIPCEGLFESDDEVTQRLANFLSLTDSSPFQAMQTQHLNARSAAGQVWLKKRYRRVHKYNQKLGKLIFRPVLLPIKSITHVSLSQEQKDQIRGVYHAENQKLNEVTGGLLTPFNYC